MHSPSRQAEPSVHEAPVRPDPTMGSHARARAPVAVSSMIWQVVPEHCASDVHAVRVAPLLDDEPALDAPDPDEAAEDDPDPLLALVEEPEEPDDALIDEEAALSVPVPPPSAPASRLLPPPSPVAESARLLPPSIPLPPSPVALPPVEDPPVPALLLDALPPSPVAPDPVVDPPVEAPLWLPVLAPLLEPLALRPVVELPVVLPPWLALLALLLESLPPSPAVASMPGPSAASPPPHAAAPIETEAKRAARQGMESALMVRPRDAGLHPPVNSRPGVATVAAGVECERTGVAPRRASGGLDGERNVRHRMAVVSEPTPDVLDKTASLVSYVRNAKFRTSCLASWNGAVATHRFH
jgi:hypothetical protein